MIRFLSRHSPISRQRGQMVVLFALGMTAVISFVGLAIDGGYAFLQYRQAQNAADFAALSASDRLLYQCSGGQYGAPVATAPEIANLINNSIANNAPQVSVRAPYGWSANYLDSTKQDLGAVSQSGAGTVPNNACGISITVTPKWPPFIAQLIDIVNWSAPASASALNSGIPSQLAGTGILALAQNGAHTILEAGNGDFVVHGTIFDNANGQLDPAGDDWDAPDVIDGKQNGKMSVYGNIESVVNSPFDWCFGNPPIGGDQTSGTPTSVADCSANNTTLAYYGWTGNHNLISTDPIATQTPAPTEADAGCAGAATNGTTSVLGNTTYYYPGIYLGPVAITGNAVFLNCSETPADLNPAGPSANPGIFWFADGLSVAPAANDQVSGADVLLVTTQVIPNHVISSSNQNVGDGEPDIGTGSGYCTAESSYCNAPSTGRHATTDYCSPDSGSADLPGTNCNSDASADGDCKPNCVFADNSTTDQGLDDSAYFGGQGIVDISGPQSGTWDYFVLWQISSDKANIGLDSLAGDSANITLDGVVYNNSDFGGQDLSNEHYWAGDSSLPYLSGGMLVAGFGVATGPGGTGLYGGDITIAAATVDIFQTQGSASLNITGSAYQIPGVQSSGSALVA